MPPATTPTFWLLDGATGWRTGTADDVEVSAVDGIYLAPAPDGPLAVDSDDGSLGGLTLPARVAVGGDRTPYLLARHGNVVRRFDPYTETFSDLPGIGAGSTGARGLDAPTGIAIAGHRLYVADTPGAARVLVFALPTLALLHVWTGWERVDLAAHGDAGYVLDQTNGRVLRHLGGTDALTVVVDRAEAANRWARLAVDRDGRLYLRRTGSTVIDVFDSSGMPLPPPGDPGELRDRFDPPLIRTDSGGRLVVPARLTCRPRDGDLLFDGNGDPATRVEGERQPARYASAGSWISAALDSDIYRCQWHRIELEIGDLPPGSQVVVTTYTDDRARAGSEIAGLADDRWSAGHVVAGPTQPQPGVPAADSDEFLVQSRPGQYLWLRLRLRGDGHRTPALRAIRVHFPRESYLAHLPAVYAADDDSRWFIERFLSIFQTEWDAIEDVIETFARYLDPRAVPGGAPLDYLARWLAVPLEGDWDDAQRRRLLAAVPGLSARRGTPDAIGRYLQVYLENMTGLTLDDTGYPQLAEGFRERDRLLLSTPSAMLSRGAPLWSPGVVGRLQLDVFAQEGQARLVSTGDPERDLFHEFAHRFRVFLPAAWVRTAADEHRVRRALDAEKPAHTSYDLCLVEPWFRVGVQSTIGLDTIVAAAPVAALACPHEDLAPSRPVSHRLGFDTVLSCSSAHRPAPPLGLGVRLL